MYPLTKTYSAQAPKPRRSIVGRLLTYTLVGGTLFYAGSLPLVAVSDEYRDFFAEHVPGGDSILEMADTRALGDQMRDMQVDDYVRTGANALRSGFSRVRTFVEDNAQVQQTREQVEKHASDLQERVRAQLEELRSHVGDEAHVVEDQIKHLRENSSTWLEQAAELGEKSLAQVRSKASEVASGVQETVSQAVPGIPAPKRDESTPVFEELPIGHEAPSGYAAPSHERKLQAPTASSGALRTDPGAPRLPLLAPSLKSLAGSEPIVSQLASTIDDLAKFVRETPSGGAVARGVLESAQADLKNLVERLDAIKQKDARTLELQLAKQARDYETELDKAAKAAAGDLEKHDADWEARFKELQSRQVSEFKGRLAKELEVQSALINERLHEEVVARGVELQRRWTKEIHAKVEQERAGRLARLDELAKELHNLQEVSLANSAELDVNNGIHAVAGALRVLRSAIDEPADEASSYVRRTFTKELETLRAARGTRDDQVAAAALDALESSKVAESGVESVPTLTEWFNVRLAPRLRRVALLPEHGAGVLSYLVSAAAAPFLSVRAGLVGGDDVQSTVARAEWHLEHRDLDAAAREVNQLRGWAKILAGDWLEAARRRLETDQALELVDTANTFNAMLRT